MKKRITLLLVFVMVLSILVGCAREKTRPPVVFADIGWDSILFHNAVAMFVAENAYGLDTKEVSGSTPITYTALLSGDIDVFMEMWTDNLEYYKDDLEQGKLKELGLNFGDNIQGLYVPRYVIEGDSERGIEPMAPDLKTVEDLKKYPEVFADPDEPSKGRIYGAMSGWEIDLIMRKKYEYYGLNENFNYFDPGTDSALAAVIASSYERGEAIVGYYWEPTWLLGKYDMVLLEDAPYDENLYADGMTACPSVNVMVCASNGFYEREPDFCKFLSKYHTSSALTSEALAYMQDTGSSLSDTAIWFLKQNDALIDQWLEADKAKLVRDALGA